MAVGVLLCLLAAVCWTVATRTALAAWLTVALSAAWLPANNGHLEGDTLVVLSNTHGVTQADAVGVVCWLGASVVVGRRAFLAAGGGAGVRSAMTLLTSGLVFALGALVAVATG